MNPRFISTLMPYVRTQEYIAKTAGYWYKLVMNRAITRIGRITDKRNDDYVPGALNSRLSLVWPLTQEAASLSRHYDVKQRLQRHVAVVSRRTS